MAHLFIDLSLIHHAFTSKTICGIISEVNLDFFVRTDAVIQISQIVINDGLLTVQVTERELRYWNAIASCEFEKEQRRNDRRSRIAEPRKPRTVLS
jgi:hypothetical protein